MGTLAIACLCGACAGPSALEGELSPRLAEPKTMAQPEDVVPRPPSFSAQLAMGRELFAERCAGCHDGENGPGPPLIGPAALPRERDVEWFERERDFVTAGDVLDWVSENMPDNHPGGLAQTQYEAIVAWVLYQNALGLHLGADGRPLTEDIADDIPLRP